MHPIVRCEEILGFETLSQRSAVIRCSLFLPMLTLSARSAVSQAMWFSLLVDTDQFKRMFSIQIAKICAVRHDFQRCLVFSRRYGYSLDLTSQRNAGAVLVINPTPESNKTFDSSIGNFLKLLRL